MWKMLHRLSKDTNEIPVVTSLEFGAGVILPLAERGDAGNERLAELNMDL